MALTKLEKIADIQKQIEQLKNQQKLYQQQHNDQERKARTKRLCRRMGLFESLLPEIITLTEEQFKTFLKKAVTNSYGHDILNKIIAQGNATGTRQGAKTAAQTDNGNSIEEPQIGFGDDEDGGE